LGDELKGDSEELLSVREIAEELGIGESTAWLLIRRHNLTRYRAPARGKTTLVRRGDVERAYRTPRPITDDRAKSRRPDES
jgi:excisionase family DNA binding protein